MQTVDTRARLLDYGARFYADQGERFTLTALAKAAGVARLTVHRLFGSKQALLQTLAKERGLRIDPGGLGDLQTRILRAAGKVFARRGYAGATMAGIAGLAGVGVASVYRLFGNKEALFAALLRELGARQAAAELQPGLDASRTLSGFVQSLLRSGVEHRDLMLIGLKAMETGPELARQLQAGPKQERTLYKLAHYLGVLQAAGRLREDVSPIELALVFEGMMSAFSFLAPFMYGLPDGDPERLGQLLTEIFLHGAAKKQGRT